MPDLLDHLEKRRTIPAAFLAAPGPSQEELARLLTIAARVPDHGKLAPWRFVVYQLKDADQIGAFLEARWKEIEPSADDKRCALERGRFARAGLVVGVISTARPHSKIPEWEQFLSSGAVCMNLIHGAAALGYGAQWLSEWYAEDEVARTYLGCKEGERFAGFMYIGTPTAPPSERARPKVSEITATWSPA